MIETRRFDASIASVDCAAADPRTPHLRHLIARNPADCINRRAAFARPTTVPSCCSCSCRKKLWRPCGPLPKCVRNLSQLRRQKREHFLPAAVQRRTPAVEERPFLNSSSSILNPSAVTVISIFFFSVSRSVIFWMLLCNSLSVFPCPAFEQKILADPASPVPVLFELPLDPGSIRPPLPAPSRCCSTATTR